MANTFKIITTKHSYVTKDSSSCVVIQNYFNNVDYGKKGAWPMLKDIGIMINPQYVVAIEIIVGEKLSPSPVQSSIIK